MRHSATRGAAARGVPRSARRELGDASERRAFDRASRPAALFWLAALALLAACGDPEISRAVGARCDRHDECDERCLGPSSQFPGGMCTLMCDEDDSCPGTTACVAIDDGVCLYECTIDSHCAFLGEAWRCQTLTGRGGGEEQVCIGG